MNESEEIVFLSVTERTDPFAMKRYTNPGAIWTRTVYLRGVKVDEKGDEVMVRLEGNGDFEREGGTYVFHKGKLLEGEPVGVELGVWKNDQD